MEQWEIDLRAKLDLELENGLYQFGGEKEEAINFYVKWERSLRLIREGVEPIIKEIEEGKHKDLSPATEDDFLDLMKLLSDKTNGK